VVFALVVFSLPEQAFSAVLASLVLRTGSVMSLVVAVFGSLVVWAALGYMMCADGSRRARGEANVSPMQRNFYAWIVQVFVAIVLLASAGGLMLLDPVEEEFVNGTAVEDVEQVIGWSTYMSALLLIPFNAIVQNLHALYEGYLFNHDHSRSTDIMYWVNVLAVFANGPLLAVNWLAAEDLNSESQEMAVVLGVCVGLLLVMWTYFAFVDPRLGPKYSVGTAVSQGGGTEEEGKPQELAIEGMGPYNAHSQGRASGQSRSAGQNLDDDLDVNMSPLSDEEQAFHDEADERLKSSHMVSLDSEARRSPTVAGSPYPVSPLSAGVSDRIRQWEKNGENAHEEVSVDKSVRSDYTDS